jgi:hypothetical protein
VSRHGWPYIGAALGGAVSVAANVAHSYVPPAHAAPGWRPEPGAVVAAVFWPVALFVVVEIVARTDWPAGRRWVVLRYAGLLPVALVAAVVSYRHLSGLLDHYAESALTARLGPLAVDGLMVTASAALVACSQRPAPAAALDEQDQVDEDEPAEEQEPDPLLPVAREIAAELAEAGRPLSRASLTSALRARGQGIGTTRATELLTQLRAA